VELKLAKKLQDLALELPLGNLPVPWLQIKPVKKLPVQGLLVANLVVFG